MTNDSGAKHSGQVILIHLTQRTMHYPEKQHECGCKTSKLKVYEGRVAEIPKLEHFTSANVVLGRPGCLC